MKTDLKISLVQADLAWHAVDENFKRLDELISGIRRSDVIILPEMFSTGFTMDVSVAEKMSGKAMSWLKNKAMSLGSAITGSLVIREQDNVFNRLVWMNPDGTYSTYDKRHLFRMANEHEHYTAGSEKLIVEVHGWKICPLVCYDLRFPVWSRNRFTPEGTGEYDVLIYVANWPEKRRLPWNKLLPARGIENLSYVVGVNRVGKDGNDISYSGDSAAYDFTGFRLTNLEPYITGVETISLDRDKLHHFRKSFPAYTDADQFEIRV